MSMEEKIKFWKGINDNYFTSTNDFKVHQLINNQSQFTNSKQKINPPNHKSKSSMISDEIENLKKDIELKEYDNMNKFEQIKLKCTKDEYTDDINDKQIRIDNIMKQLFEIQIKQFAESIYSIRTNKENSLYQIEFDPNEIDLTLTLTHREYEDFIKHRNPSNSVCLFDIFQEKIHSYYTPNKEIKIKEKKQNEAVTIPKSIKIDNYGYCHHCKQRKPFEIMLKCNSCKNSYFNCDFPTKILTINNNTLLIKSNYLYNI